MNNEVRSDHDLVWEDGDVPVSTMFDDTFYSRHDGRAETAYVFLDGNGLPDRWSDVESFSVGELGFGTGLNFLETWHQWSATRSPEQRLRFTSFELYPISNDAMARALSVWPELEQLAGALIADWTHVKGGGMVDLDAQTTLEIVNGEAEAGVGAWTGRADAWYLDGFSPAKNADMWSAALMQNVATHTNSGGTCATYTSAGWVRRNLEEAGFCVTKRAGHGRKREMITGVLRD